MKKQFLLVLTTVLLAPLSGLAATENSTPNIVVIVADDMGWGDAATFGNELIQTPNMDRLAAEGVKLTQCYSACGVCSPSRSAIVKLPAQSPHWSHKDEP